MKIFSWSISNANWHRLTIDQHLSWEEDPWVGGPIPSTTSRWQQYPLYSPNIHNNSNRLPLSVHPFHSLDISEWNSYNNVLLRRKHPVPDKLYPAPHSSWPVQTSRYVRWHLPASPIPPLWLHQTHWTTHNPRQHIATGYNKVAIPDYHEGIREFPGLPLSTSRAGCCCSNSVPHRNGHRLNHDSRQKDGW